MASSTRSHLLIISDVHIGEYVKEVDRIGYIKGFNRRDESLCAFLEYHQRRWIGGVPWRLVINGDFIDFIAVTFRPDETTQSQRPELRLSEDESAWGLDSSEDKVVWKLDQIVDRHRMLFAYLADFVGQGNSVEVLYGNHDVEFWWPEVHEAFREHLRRIFYGGESVGRDASAEGQASFLSRVRFHPWFLHEPGRFYIEHGNQYDDFSSFEFRLNPLAPYDNNQLAMPVSHMAIRYFVNQYKGFRSHNKDNWTVVEYFRWLGEQGMDNTLRIFKLSFGLAAHIMAYARVTRAAEDEALAQVHRERLDALAEELGMAPEVVRELDALRYSPITESFGRTAQTVGIDRQVLAAVWLGLSFFVLAIPFSWGWTLMLLGAIALGAALSRAAWPMVRDRYLGGHVSTAVEPKVDKAAARIAALLGVRYVFFGHTHKPKKVKVAEAGWYLNSGSWLAPRQRERHRGEGCPSRLTFIVFRDGAVPDARLFRWCARDQRPVAFDPRVDMQTLDPEQIEPSSNSHGDPAPRRRKARRLRPPQPRERP